MKKSTVKTSVISDGKLLRSTDVPAIRGYESVKEVVYDYDSSTDQTSLEIRSNRKIKDPEKLITSMVNYGNPGSSNVKVILTLISSMLCSRRTKSYLLDSYGRTMR